MEQLKRYWVMGLLGFWVITLWGCATIIEGAKGIAGVSTKVLKDNRKSAIKKIFNYDYNTCYANVEKILTHIKAYTYVKDTKKKMLAIYISKEDTTPVGIFFKEIDKTLTEIEVSSPSTYAKEFIAAKVSYYLEKLSRMQEEEEQSDVQRDAGNK